MRVYLCVCRFLSVCVCVCVCVCLFVSVFMCVYPGVCVCAYDLNKSDQQTHYFFFIFRKSKEENNYFTSLGGVSCSLDPPFPEQFCIYGWESISHLISM